MSKKPSKKRQANARGTPLPPPVTHCVTTTDHRLPQPVRRERQRT
jgi:hypothetical protein